MEYFVNDMSDTEFRYAMVNRPYSFASAPKGAKRVEPRPAPGADHHDLARHGIAVYSHALTPEQTRQFEMAPLLDGAERQALAVSVAGALQEYAAGYLQIAQEDRHYFVGVVADRVSAASDGYRASVGAMDAFAQMVLDQLHGLVI